MGIIKKVREKGERKGRRDKKGGRSGGNEGKKEENVRKKRIKGRGRKVRLKFLGSNMYRNLICAALLSIENDI